MMSCTNSGGAKKPPVVSSARESAFTSCAPTCLIPHSRALARSSSSSRAKLPWRSTLKYRSLRALASMAFCSLELDLQLIHPCFDAGDLLLSLGSRRSSTLGLSLGLIQGNLHHFPRTLELCQEFLCFRVLTPVRYCAWLPTTVVPAATSPTRPHPHLAEWWH